LSNGFQPPYVNPYPHNGHVDLQLPHGPHEYIGLGHSQFHAPQVTEQQKALGAFAIQSAVFGPPK
jgi:hypothetical protein